MKSNHHPGKRSAMMAMLLTMLAVVVIFSVVAVPAQAQTPTLLHTFYADD